MQNDSNLQPEKQRAELFKVVIDSAKFKDVHSKDLVTLVNENKDLFVKNPPVISKGTLNN